MEAIIARIIVLYMSILECVGSVRINKEQCHRLQKRIEKIVDALKGLKDVESTEKFMRSLEDLERCIQKAADLIKQFTQAHWFKKALLPWKHAFEEINKELEEAMRELNLTLDIQQVMDHDMDKKDQDADFQNIKDIMDEIRQLYGKEFRSVQLIGIEQERQGKITAKQFQSLHIHIEHIEELLQEKTRLCPSQIKLVQRICYHDIQFGPQIGTGHSGGVYLGNWDGCEVAVKTLDDESNSSDRDRLLREIQIVSQLNHPCLVRFYGASVQEPHCLVMEYMANGSLDDVLHRRGLILTDDLKLKIALNLARGLRMLHDRHIIHSDLTSSHVLLDHTWEARISGFGLSETQEGDVKKPTVKSQDPAYRAPETFEKDYPPDPASDVYSYGVLLWELLTEKRPYSDFQNDPVGLSIQLKRGYREKLPPDIPEVYADIICRAWETDPSRRIHCDEIIDKLSHYLPRPTTPPEEVYERGLKWDHEKSFDEAMRCYDLAARRGCFRALTNIGLFRLKGIAGAPNKKQAYELLCYAANRGHARAQINLGIMLEWGDGIPRNLSEALKWYEQALQTTAEAEGCIGRVRNKIAQEEFRR